MREPAQRSSISPAWSAAIASELPVRSLKCGLAFRRILGTGAPVLPIQIEHHWRDSAASTPPPLRACCFAEAAARDAPAPRWGIFFVRPMAKGEDYAPAWLSEG